MASWFPEITTYTISINVPLYVSHFAEMHVNVDRAHLQAPTALYPKQHFVADVSIYQNKGP